MTSIVAKKRIEPKEYLAVFLGITGVAICVYPLLLESYATLWGLFLLALSTLSYSGAAVYFSTINWRLEKLTINAWQVFFGAVFLLPVTFLTLEPTNAFQSDFYYSVIWLGVPVSIGAVFLWLWLLSEDSVRASYFLFLCPAFGLLYAYFILDEPFTLYTLFGLLVVMMGLWVGKRKKQTPKQHLPLD